MRPRLARIVIYPVKSLDGLRLDSADFAPGGGLLHDRRFAICDRQGNFVNGKRSPAVHALASHYDSAERSLTLRQRGAAKSVRFQIDNDRQALEDWLSDFFGMSVTLDENSQTGFPDDLESPGPTLVSTATLEAVARWFSELSVDEVRLRFRANLEIDGVDPFWEDRLCAAAGSEIRFRIGRSVLAGTNPCQRCVVPTRSPSTGTPTVGFQKLFAQRRAESLPGWAERSRFDHFYRLAVNTRTIDPQPPLRVGDELAILSTAKP